MRIIKVSILVIFLASLATAATFYAFKWDVRSSLDRICGSIEVYLQMGSYRTARELAAATLKSSYGNVDAEFYFDNLVEPTPRNTEDALFKSSCSVSGRQSTPFDIYIYANSQLKQWLGGRFIDWLIVFSLVLLILSVILRATSRVILGQVNSALGARLGVRPSNNRKDWLANWFDSVPALSEASAKTKRLIERLDQEIARSSDLELAVERRRIFSKYMHDIRSPIGALKILFNKKSEQFSPDETEIVHQVIARLENIPGLVLAGEKEARADARSQLNAQDIRTVFDHICRRLAVRFEGLCIFRSSTHGISADVVNSAILISALDLDRLITNLAENSLQAGAGQITASLSRVQNHFIFEVADDGPGGLGPDLRPLHKKISGYGLGSEIVKEIADKASATIKVESPEGQGTRVIVSFPA